MNNDNEQNTITTDDQPKAATVTLVVNINEVNTILAALQELPHRVVDPVIKNLLQQAQSQLDQPQG
jgi:hypothetical protein